MFTISALSPPSTPRGPIFSPRQNGCGRWTGYALSLQSPGKRVKLDHQPLSIKPTNASKLQFPQASTLASRRMKKAPPMALVVAKEQTQGTPTGFAIGSASPLMAGSAMESTSPLIIGSALESTGLSPIVKGLSLGRVGGGFGSMVGSPLKINSLSNHNRIKEVEDKPAAISKSNPFPLRKAKKAKPAGMQLFKEEKEKSPAALIASPLPPPIDTTAPSVTQQQQQQPLPMTFRLQKTAPAKQKKKLALGGKVSKLSVAPTGLISPPTESTPVRTQPMMKLGGLRPPALALGNAANSAMVGAPSMSPLSPSVPQTPGGNGFSGILSDCSAYGEASPSFLARKTPPPAAWAPTFFVTPPTPLVPGTRIQNSAENKAGDSSASLAPCTPPWPKSGSSLRKTIFDHIGQPQLSPMDLRGYMAVSMNN
ncbi:hypothetical protein LPJ81_005234 [Coemansia sp. IMI 209127]|nr:hypothetical protein LPJ81_005234 [Coemansia sp. IMI 209127]